ncbi:MAG: peptidoglycan-binding protein [Candidatus Pacebacteria bacterium]|nr:peptidoglycan-binding protein [Candidatus Paceibacterota bacterium]
MENFKFGIFSIIILALLAFISYWAFSSIESGSSHLYNQELKDLTRENNDLKEEITSLKNEILILKSELTENTSVVINEEPEEDNSPSTNEEVSQNQTLINELQKLINDNIYMKRGSKGERVGTVQKFLNIYNNTSTRVDNDYGPGMETAIRKYQTDRGLTVDGEAGPNTFKNMIEWLKKQ